MQFRTIGRGGLLSRLSECTCMTKHYGELYNAFAQLKTKLKGALPNEKRKKYQAFIDHELAAIEIEHAWVILHQLITNKSKKWNKRKANQLQKKCENKPGSYYGKHPLILLSKIRRNDTRENRWRSGRDSNPRPPA